MINAVQIRCARALLDWPTAELARRAGMTVNAINRIERGHVVAQRSTMDKLEEIFETAGIEFLPGSGLRKKEKKIMVYEGKDFEERLLEDISGTLKQTGGDLVIAHADGQMVSEKIDDAAFRDHRAKGKKVKISRRFLVRSDDKNFHGSDDDCHVLPIKFFSLYPLWIYGSKLALSTRKYSPRAVIIDNEPLAESIKKLFSYIWDNTVDFPAYKALEKAKKNSDKAGRSSK